MSHVYAIHEMYDFLCILYRLHFTFMKQCSKFTTMEFLFLPQKNVLL